MLRSIRRKRSSRLLALLVVAVAAMGVLAGTALATSYEYSDYINVSPSGTFYGPTEDWYYIEVCPVANFDVAAYFSSGTFNGEGLGNSSNATLPCVSTATVEHSIGQLEVANLDQTYSRAFNVYAFYDK